MENTRREFIEMSAGLAAAAKTIPAGSPLPTVRVGKYEITRLICGSNPFYGYSHAARQLDQHMREWSTPETVCAELQEVERNGLNTFQTNGQDREMGDYELYRKQGGRMQALLLMKDPPEAAVKRVSPIGVAHHGEFTDINFREGKMDLVQEFTRRARQAGVLVGVSTHNPDVIAYIEEHGWDIDFFMGCVYKRNRTPDEVRKLLGELPLPQNELYLEKDPERMYAVMRQSRHTCFAFKILAAGRLTNTPAMIDAAFRAAYKGIKPQDCVIIGNYPRFKNQIQENAARVRAILA